MSPNTPVLGPVPAAYGLTVAASEGPLEPTPRATGLLDAELCRRLDILPLDYADGLLTLAAANVQDTMRLRAVHRVLAPRLAAGNTPLRMEVIPAEVPDLRGAMERHLPAPAGPALRPLGARPGTSTSTAPTAAPGSGWLARIIDQTHGPSLGVVAPLAAPDAQRPDIPKRGWLAGIVDQTAAAPAPGAPPLAEGGPPKMRGPWLAGLPAVRELEASYAAPSWVAPPVPAEEIASIDGAPEVAPPAVPEPVLPAYGRPLGQLLLEAGVLSADELESALELQRRHGDHLGTVLTHTGLVSEDQLVDALARQLEIPSADLAGISSDAEAIALLPEDVVRRFRAVPLWIQDGELIVATPDPMDDEAIAVLDEHARIPVRLFLAADTAVDRLIQTAYATEGVDLAVNRMIEQRPEDSAYRVLSEGQKRFFIGVLVLFGLGLIASPITTLVTFTIASILFYTASSLYRLRLIDLSLAHSLELPVSDEEIAAIDERTLPVFTVLVPLYKEAAILPRIAKGLGGLDYPSTKLDIKLLLEADDVETVEAARAMNLPPQFKIVVVPDAQPKTKPKACNYGLLQARGDLVVIYDAEDRPDADQLKKVAIAFAKAAPEVSCIQCKLNYYNRNQNPLTGWFTTEYSMWFDLVMPGLDATGAPIPLGGTSNHFVTSHLMALGAWDPHNVAEDADLGIRLWKAGRRTAVIDSTTLEEANSDVHNWIRQRSRWVKGYIQTWLVHMRNPMKLRRQLGWKAFVSFQLVVGGTFITFLLNPIYWALTTLFAMTHLGLIRDIFPSFLFYAAAAGLFLGNFTFAYLTAAGCMKRRYFELVKYALISPVYWGLMSLGAWKGFIQLFTNPFYWEKTIHGLDGEDEH